MDIADWKKLLSYDPETGVFVWLSRSGNRSNSWNAKYAGRQAGGIDRPDGYIKIKGSYAHRLAWAFVHGSWPLADIDHINGDKSDNRIANLREVDRKRNMRNAPRSSSNSSGITGVKWHARARKWQAQITVDGREVYLGLFASKKEAAIARKHAEKKHGFHPNHGRHTSKLQQERHG